MTDDTMKRQTVGTDCRVPDPSDAAADGAFGGVRAGHDHRAGYGGLDTLLAHARKGYDVRGSQAALMVAEIDWLRGQLEAIRHLTHLADVPATDIVRAVRDILSAGGSRA